MRTICVAASNAPDSDKLIADFLCDGANDQEQIQAAITQAMTNGHMVLLSKGNFVVSASIIISGTVVIAGMGEHFTTVESEIALNDYIFKFEGDETDGVINAKFHGFTLDCHADSQSAGGGFDASGAVQCRFEHLRILNPYDWGIFFSGIDTEAPIFGHHNQVNTCLFNNTILPGGFGGGVFFEFSDENVISNCDFEEMGGSTAPTGGDPCAVLDTSGLQTVISTVFVGGKNAGVQLKFHDTKMSKVVSCIFDASNGHSVVLTGNYHLATGNIVSSPGLEGSTPASGIVLGVGAVGCTVVGNTLETAAEAGKTRSLIWETADGGAGSNVIAGNALREQEAPTVSLVELNGANSVYSSNSPEIGTPPYVPTSGGTIIGDLTIADPGNHAFRLRSTGSANDFEATGDDLILSVWSGTDFDGTQRSYDRYSADATNVQHAGKREWVAALFGGAVHTIDPTTGVASLGAKNSLTNINFCGFKNSAGAPASGTWATGDLIIDSAGDWHLCTVGGTPGTWT